MIIVAKYLWEIGSVIIALMGIMHLRLTFFSNKFSSRNEDLVAEMKVSHPIFTNKMNMWNAWIGFNGTHSLAAIFIGVVNGYLAARHFDLMRSDHFFFLFSMLSVAFIIWVAKTYWFRGIVIGVSTTFVCYLVAYILVLVS